MMIAFMAHRSPIMAAALLGAGICALGATQPASAQAAASERVFVDLGRWTIYEDTRASSPRNCVMRSPQRNQASLAYRKIGTNPAQMSISTPRSNSVFVGVLMLICAGFVPILR